MAASQQAATTGTDTNNRTFANHGNLTMREFFKGWRRKSGCVTLVMACVFAMGWVRSFRNADIVQFTIAGKLHAVTSLVGEIEWVSTDDNDHEITFRHVWFRAHEFLRLLGEDAEREKARLAAGGYSSQTPNWKIPYWSIVLPLTLLSAWLLFSKPRQTAPKQPTEPAPTTGP